MKWTFLFIALLLVSVVAASEYEYVSVINAHCEEYEGYVQFDLPANFNTAHAYSAETIWIAQPQTWLQKQPNWFVTGEHEIHDEDFSTSTSFTGNEVVFSFQNPDVRTINKIHIDTQDSLITGVNLPAGYNVQRQGFHYEYTFSDGYTANKLEMSIAFEDLLKVKEISFFQEQTTPSEKGYFYVNNDCSEQRLLYFGSYGESNVRRGTQPLPIVFETTVITKKNLDYNTDFDNDTHANDNDNCPYVANPDQKDINYNGQGDACDDKDNDGVVNSEDNCPEKANRNQYDEDKDGMGDACDEEDNRFFEENAVWVYVLAGVIILLFIVFSFNLVRKK